MECTPVYILPPGIAWAMVILPALLIIAGAIRLHGGAGWSPETIVDNLAPLLENGGYVPEGRRVEVVTVDHDGNRVPLGRGR